MRIIYFGNSDRGFICLKHLIEKNYKVDLVVVHNNDLTKNATAQYAKSQDIETIHPENVNSKESIAILRKTKPDLIILSGYSQIIKDEIIKLPTWGCINLHGGKLPKYRGSSPINWSLIQGETEGGISIIKINRGIDTGAILAEKTFKIEPEDNAKTIKEKTLQLFPTMLTKTIDSIMAGKIVEKENSDLESTYYPLRKPDDGLIIWEQMTAEQIFNLIRALVKPYPGAFSILKSRKKIWIWKARPIEKTIRGIPGRIILKRDKSAFVMCQDRCIAVDRVQLEGEDESDASNILRYGDEFLTTRTLLLESIS